MASHDIIDLNNISEDSHLTTLESGDTPTLNNDGESPTIHALNIAASDAAYDLVIGRIPQEHRLKILGIHYVDYDPYYPKRSKRTAWYFGQAQAQELICTSKGNFYYYNH